MEQTFTTSCGPLRIRTTSAHDMAAFRELRLEALWMHPEAFGSDHADSAAKPAEWWIDRAQAGSGNANQVLYVAQAPTGELVGMCGLFREQGPKVEHNGHIWGVYVRPAWRGLKVADALLEACEAWARRHGVRVMRLSVVTSNTAARRCYERRGFIVSGTAAQAIRHGETYYDELLMSKLLAATPHTGAAQERDHIGAR